MTNNLGTYLGDVLLKAKVFGLATPPGEPPLQHAQLSVVGDDASLGIPVLRGDPGAAGAPAAPFKWQFPSLDSASELPTLTNTPTDVGKAYVINDGTGTADIAYWTGTQWRYFVDAFGPGLPGPVPDITVDGELVAAGDPFAVVVSGTAEAPHLHFQVPAVPGPQGPSGPWQLYDDTQTRDTGDVPVWSDAAAKYEPRSLLELGSFPRVLRYTQPEGAFTAYTGTNGSHTMCVMSLPSLAYAYHVDVHGHVRVSRAGDATTRVAIVVRLGDASSGQIVGKGMAVESGPCIIVPHYSSQESGKTNLTATPDGATGRTAAEASALLYATAVVVDGAGSWSVAAVDAQLSVSLIPANA
ncbi:hypothetical protein [Gordonia sp. (in: high G+C Gram-positive bacteria)]|uniref:hypothetical protein n=1 Tax=Gordonia sp. (in: high G+C Gram-positive bacteria) TaxID=84139 RepID=UPI001DEF5203|nr:hypothetical protein [Gordonia sp. (in: high G+C Gram-positive bacteria)]MCB1294847.1 hypothetical protein [Gordonia sp. (in: high G+C Gram-positive bacteria)]HMS75595.1 hypothetical protein [Gordonia sp. (in: high G+C Gram-positive bacteria)]